MVCFSRIATGAGFSEREAEDVREQSWKGFSLDILRRAGRAGVRISYVSLSVSMCVCATTAPAVIQAAGVQDE